MQYLLDTHTILWVQSKDDNLSKKAKEIIENTENQCYVSIASLWEMAIKVTTKKLTIAIGFKNFYNYLISNHFKVLSINQLHLNILISLPFHHKDPFDRLLISQAITENLTLISADQHFKSYPVNLIW